MSTSCQNACGSTSGDARGSRGPGPQLQENRLCRLFRMVLLEMARAILPDRPAHWCMVRSLRRAIRHGRDQRVLLFLADRGKCEGLASSAWTAKLRLYGEGLRAITHIKRFKGTKALVEDFGMIADILGERMDAFCSSCRRAIQYNESEAAGHSGPARSCPTECARISPRKLVERHCVRGLSRYRYHLCSCSGPRLPDVLVRTADDVYLPHARSRPLVSARLFGRRTWRNGPTGFAKAGRRGRGSISTTTTEALRRGMP